MIARYRRYSASGRLLEGAVVRVKRTATTSEIVAAARCKLDGEVPL